MNEINPISYAEIYLSYGRFKDAYSVLKRDWDKISSNSEDLNRANLVLNKMLERVVDQELIDSIKTLLPLENDENKNISGFSKHLTERAVKKYKYMLSILIENSEKSYSYPQRVLVDLNNKIGTIKSVKELDELYLNKNWALLSYVEIED